MGKKRRVKGNSTQQESAAEISAEATPISTSIADPPSPSVSPLARTRLQRRGRHATVPDSRNSPESIEINSIAAVPNSTSPRLRKRGRPKSSEPLVHSPIPTEVADFIRELDEEDPTTKLRRLRKQGIREEEVDEQSEPAASTCSQRKKAEKDTHHETATHGSYTDECQGEAAETESPPEAPVFFSDDEVKARAGLSGASSSAAPTTDSTPQWASQLLTAIKALGDCVTTLEDTIRHLIPPSDS